MVAATNGERRATSTDSIALIPPELSRTSFDSSYYIASGTQIVVTGQIVEKHPFVLRDEGGEVVEEWQRILIESAPKIFVQVFATDEAAGLPLGAQVNVVGRYWGVRKPLSSFPTKSLLLGVIRLLSKQHLRCKPRRFRCRPWPPLRERSLSMNNPTTW